MDYIKKYPPKCKQCKHIEEDDPKRILFTFFDKDNKSDIVAVRCPSLKCGNGWLIESAFDKIIFADKKDITDEILQILKCQETDLHIGNPEMSNAPSPVEILTALFGPPIIVYKK